MIRITTASAGSGKTYTLAKTYIDLLLDRYGEDPHSYRHILAVTFTNKATAEMKERILKELHERSKTDVRAKALLAGILHDYSAFAVSTIDKFFQQTLRSFSREIGQFAQYQIELDRKSLIHEAMDRILDSLTSESKDVLEWLGSEMSERLACGKATRFEDALYEMGERLKSEDHRSVLERSGICEDYSKERLADVRKGCRKLRMAFHDAVKRAADEIAPSLTKKHSINAIAKYQNPGEPWEDVTRPIKTLLDEAEGSDFAELFLGDEFKAYNTAGLIEKQAFSLGLAREFYAQFDALLKEKNIMCLDESNTILRDIIDGSDAPFVYEKLGVRFENFLLDEFQDTSNIQWSNFLPLLKESESKGSDCLIVGDIKQSIYRFRDSDWKLLDEKVPEAFTDKIVNSLDCNWRSTRTVVEFNNGFFKYAAAALGKETIYETVEQKVQSDDPQKGQVRISFTDDQDRAVLDSVYDALKAGALPSDIAVLVRFNKEGGHLASCLIDAGYKVISDDSLALKSSALIRRVVSILSAIEKPGDTLSSYMARDLGISIPDSYHSLFDLCEEILRALHSICEEAFEGETLFIQGFLDEVRKFADNYGNDLQAFLRHWGEKNYNPFIGSPDDKSAIRVLTIHKSKGLEFPYVIFPYAEKVETERGGDTKWCALSTEGTSLPERAAGLYPVDMENKVLGTFFEKDYLNELEMGKVDNLNAFYVAMTRAGKVLHVIAKEPGKGFQDNIRKGSPITFKDMSQILFRYVNDDFEHTFGEPYDFNRMVRKSSSDIHPFEGRFVSYPRNPDSGHQRLKASEEAFDYFGEDGIGTSARLAGIELHSILSSVRVPSDLHGAVEEAVRDGIVENGAEVEEFLASRIALHPEWFPEDASAVFNEVEMIDCNGAFCRPDRVVRTAGGRIVVIDYKFGERRDSYDRQVARYVQLYRDLGYESVEGVVWYVRED